MKRNKTIFTFSLSSERDKELIDWLNEQPNRSDAIRKALAETMTAQEKQYSRILDILEELQSRDFAAVSNGSNPQVTEQVEETEPQDMADTLDNLGAQNGTT